HRRRCRRAARARSPGTGAVFAARFPWPASCDLGKKTLEPSSSVAVTAASVVFGGVGDGGIAEPVITSLHPWQQQQQALRIACPRRGFVSLFPPRFSTPPRFPTAGFATDK
ncbi:unnamed protein product, partial [Ectocarpus fasciculatus]